MRPKIAFRFTLPLLCVLVGLYPLVYLLAGGRFGILQTKADSLKLTVWWQVGFYVHILFGGIALSVGWLQFISSWRVRFTKVHRWLGVTYVGSVIPSGAAALCIAPFSSTGWVAAMGFGSLGVIWVLVTAIAFRYAKQHDYPRHEQYMIYSYSCCMAAVSLRIWLPLLTVVCHIDFSVAYPIVAWLCWLPNVLGAGYIVNRKKRLNNIVTSSN